MAIRKIKIANRVIAENEPTFIIAEVGINHNGDINLAKKLIDKAKEIGVDCVKFQTYKTENLVSNSTPLAEYQKETGISTQYELLKKCELSTNQFKELKRYCDKKNIIFLSTPHTDDAIEILDELVPVYKIASGDLTNLPFLQKVAKKKKPVILSTGMATMDEVEEAVESILKFNKKLILLHCTSVYPTQFKDCNLLAIKTLKDKFNLIVGYSDHTLGIEVAIAAVTLGAKVIEKHFTLDKTLPGPDHKVSLEPPEFKELIQKIRNVEDSLGSSEKKYTKSEIELRKISRKSIVAAATIPKGSKITKEMVTIKRVVNGIAPKYLDKIIGKVTNKEIKYNQPITWKILTTQNIRPDKTVR